jgi:glyoxylase-like metal-dependent hydrolase (beta-lactamase superfamily II)
VSLVVRGIPTGPFQENSYVVGCSESRQALLIDPGDEPDRIASLLEAEGLTPVGIVNTHAHIDHIGAVRAFQDRAKLPFSIHAGDKVWLEALADQAAFFRLPAPGAPQVDHWLEDGEQLSVGQHTFRVIHTPGHTPGGCCFFFEKEQVLITGDTLFVGSVGRTDFPYGSWPDLERSIQEKLFPLGDDVVFHPGHGPAGRLGDERLHNPFVGEGDKGPRRPRFV